ncbi:calmin isoform X2 [Melanotaenia boesemani]|uniref:calmin isoform X2 n=1 Tax=Melanotaenia boesemani TaxID=1250792 RepID=UPI001C042792|nr:calmin isoform X2 [Melanotaenia boesemani]
MAGHELEDWFEREEFIGQISDIRVQNLQVEREAVQKRTFTRWMNLHLEKCDPPLQVDDLFQDIQDGHVLMSLLEELSGCKLLHGFKKSSHRIFRLNNIAKVLSFLEERNVKLVSIDAADVADGNSSIILGLIWNIILFFQIKELTGNIRSQFPSSSSLSSIPTSSDSDASCSSTPSEERPSAAAAMKENSRAIKKLLQWIQKRTRRYSVTVQDFGKSWTSGLAFLAVIKSIDSSLVDMRKALLRSPRENLEDAFRIAHYSLGIPRLLEPEDVAVNVPDEQSIIMYVSQFLEHFPGIEEPEESFQLIERSVSMGRLNFHDGDLDRARNGAPRGRVRGRALMFQKDQPPPKILISSMSEDRSILSPRLRVATTRSWSSEDFLADSPNIEHVSSIHGNPQIPDSACDSPQQAFARSPESGNTESLICDSAINSPDSWVESEMTLDTRSDGSLWDTRADLYRATPVEVTTLDEGFMSSLEERVPDESISGSYMEEEMSSLDKNQEEPLKEKDTHLQNQNQDQVPDQTLDLRETDSETMEGDPIQQDRVPTEPALTLCKAEGWTRTSTEDMDPDQVNHIQLVLSPVAEIFHREEPDGEEPDGAKTYRTGSQSEPGPPQDGRTGSELLEEGDKRGDEGTRSFKDHVLDSAKHKPGPQSSLNIPLISISTEPDDQNQESGGEDKGLSSSDGQNQICREGDDRVRSEEISCPISENTEPEPSELVRGTETHHVDETDKHDGSYWTHSTGARHETGSGHDGSQTESDVTAPPTSKAETSDQDQGPNHKSDRHQDQPTDALHHSETENTHQNLLDPVDSQQNLLGPDDTQQNLLDPFDTQQNLLDPDDTQQNLLDPEDLVGDPVEPMDLFYPDKEELGFPEPPDTDMQRWPSVLSVSALQPAPVSDADPEDHRPDLMKDQEDVKVICQTSEESSDPSASLEQCMLCGVTIGGLQGGDVPADGGDLRDSDGEGMESVRRDAGSSSRPEVIQIPPVLRHRKGAHLTESTTHQRAAPRRAHNEDSDFWENPELYLLLLLWLLLYSFWLLPQMDLKTLPSLLLNLDR